MPTQKQMVITIAIVLFLALIGGAIFWARTAPEDSASEWQEANLSKQALSLGDSAETYNNDQYSFSLKYPQEFNVGEFSEGPNTSIVIQNAEEQTGFQIYIKPLEENLKLTETKLREQVPDMNVTDVTSTTVSDVDNALAFKARNDAFGQSYEVWFVKDRTLFQLSTYREQKKLLERAVDTWKFE